jgi:hypothetical protein
MIKTCRTAECVSLSKMRTKVAAMSEIYSKPRGSIALLGQESEVELLFERATKLSVGCVVKQPMKTSNNLYGRYLVLTDLRSDFHRV